jgi:hypothetical protein
MREDEIKALVEKTLAENRSQFVLAGGWLDNLKFSGDMRLRYEYRDNTADKNNDERARLRLRFGFQKTWPDQDMLLSFRLSTGADSSPLTENQTFTAFQKYPVWVDQAYAQWTPKALPGLSITAGKMPKPWETSDLVWDPDINYDGVWIRYNVPNLGPVTPFVGAGFYQLYESGKIFNTALEAYDAGVRYQITKDIKFTSAVTFYDYNNIDAAYVAGVLNGGAGANTVKGGHLVSGYKTLDFTNKLDFVAWGVPMNIFIDWAHNTDAVGLPANSTDGLAVGLKVGANKKKGDWSAWFVWESLEANAVLAAFADDDFGWNTQTNRRGTQIGVAYNITDSLTAGVKVYNTAPMTGAFKASRFIMQADLVWKF